MIQDKTYQISIPNADLKIHSFIPNNWARCKDHWREMEDTTAALLSSMILMIEKSDDVEWCGIRLPTEEEVKEIYQVINYSPGLDALIADSRFIVWIYKMSKGRITKHSREIKVRLCAKAPGKRKENWSKRKDSFIVSIDYPPLRNYNLSFASPTISSIPFSSDKAEGVTKAAINFLDNITGQCKDENTRIMISLRTRKLEGYEKTEP